MCGIAGYWALRGMETARLDPLGHAMAATLDCRGPDDRGIWIDEKSGLVLSQTRLAIIDLSDAGRQPMISADGRYIIVYNGEVYELDDLRTELQDAGTTFRGHSDTEVILEAWATWGPHALLHRLTGMFAMAVWDRKERRLTLVRDRLGIKPLYWGRVRNSILFASELKAIRKACEDTPAINPTALAGYLRFGYVPAPLSIYRNIAKLPPGHMLEIEADGTEHIDEWWNLRDVAQASASRNWRPGRQEAEDQLDQLLRRAVGARMVADVPLGAFLSGGIDSSMVVAQMQAQSSRPIKTYTIGFTDKGYDESVAARRVAAHLGTDHHELILEPGEALSVIPSLAEWYDEPFADSSQIPTYLVSRFARESVTVALSGDGGDEMFGGYNRYVWGGALWRKLGHWPGGLRRLAAAALNATPRGLWTASETLPGAPRMAAIKAAKLATVLRVDNETDLYLALVSFWTPEILMQGSNGLENFPARDGAMLMPGLAEHMQVLDGMTYLPDDILTKVDRASMAVGLEARVPLLDHRIAEFAFALPREFRIDGRVGKVLLRNVLARYVPRTLFERPKMGFALPVGDWLRGPLRDWAEDLLNPVDLEMSGLNPAPIATMWAQHLKGHVSREAEMWIILMYRLWHRRWIENKS